MKSLQREDAVSPVIGVILMVAITVILAAVIAAFVFGMAGGISKTRTVAVTARKNADNVVITYQGGPDDPLLAAISAQFDDSGPLLCFDSANLTHFKLEEPPTPTGCPTPLKPDNKPAVGSTATASSTGGTFACRQVHTMITGIFTDGSKQVLLDTYV